VPKLRVGVADTLDARPLAWGLLKGHHADLFSPVGHPAPLIGRLLEQRGVDIALTPAIEVARLGGLRVLPDLCVSFPAEARSLVLLSPSPVAEVCRVLRERCTPTAAAVTSIVLEERYGRRPEMVELDPGGLGPLGLARSLTRRLARSLAELTSGEALLLTGGVGLAASIERLDATGLRRLHRMDLGTAWRELTGLPLVVGVWAVREGVRLPELPFYFKSSLRYGLSSLDAIAREAAAELGVGSLVISDYLRHTVGYFLQDDELRSLEELFRRAARHGLVPERRLAVYAPSRPHHGPTS
jgi:chorismate dehydratase